MMSYVTKHSKLRKTTKVIKLRWICIDLTSKRSKMLSYVANHSKPLNYKSDQNTMTCIDLMSKRSKQRKTQTRSNYDEFASIWRQNDQKCWVTSQNILNNRKTTKVIKLQWLASIYQKRQNDKKYFVMFKTFETTENYKVIFKSIWRPNDL